MSPETKDRWLDRLLPLIEEHAGGGGPVLELGCGGGRDSAVLAAAGFKVIGVDRSALAIDEALRKVPAGVFHCQDLQASFPVAEGVVGAVIASLCLHYFPWDETVELLERIGRTLRPNGLLLCRVNSTNDHHYGASGFPPIAENFYLVDGAPKRFFDRPAIDRLFAEGWRILTADEMLIERYEYPKFVWQAVLERGP
jgi:SAM-dependent methyltransferase